MKLRSNGIAKFIYGWNQHAMHAQVGTELNLSEVAKGTLSNFPVSFQVSMKYWYVSLFVYKWIDFNSIIFKPFLKQLQINFISR